MTTPGLRDFVLEAPTGEEPAEDLLAAAFAALSQAFTLTAQAGAPRAAPAGGHGWTPSTGGCTGPG